MRDVTYTPSKLYMDIKDTSRHNHTLNSKIRIPIVAMSTNSAGETLYMYRKKSREGSYIVLFQENPITIFEEGLTYEEIVASCRHYRWVHQANCIISEGNKTYKNQLQQL